MEKRPKISFVLNYCTVERVNHLLLDIKETWLEQTESEEIYSATLQVIRNINKYCKVPHEIILVDNNSTDKTVQKATIAGVKKIFVIKNFLPGKALNLGIKKSLGEYIVCLSAHCIPTNKDWLKNLSTQFFDKFKKRVQFFGIFIPNLLDERTDS